MMHQAIIGGICAAITLWLGPVGFAEDRSIFRIEEDWELRINDPDPANFSPQITLFVSPSVNSEVDYFQVQLNYSADSEFSGGGFDVAAVRGGDVADEVRSVTSQALSESNDEIRWTNVMVVVNEKLLFAVKNGSSQVWGEFGGPEYLVEIPEAAYPDLAEYHPQQTLDTVDIGFGANRVDSLTLVRVRVYYTDGKVTTVPVNRQP
ncbi:MAG: hypothetical protein AB8B91_19590 [Rubripirellula sp.]